MKWKVIHKCVLDWPYFLFHYDDNISQQPNHFMIQCCSICLTADSWEVSHQSQSPFSSSLMSFYWIVINVFMFQLLPLLHYYPAPIDYQFTFQLEKPTLAPIPLSATISEPWLTLIVVWICYLLYVSFSYIYFRVT